MKGTPKLTFNLVLLEPAAGLLCLLRISRCGRIFGELMTWVLPLGREVYSAVTVPVQSRWKVFRMRAISYHLPE